MQDYIVSATQIIPSKEEDIVFSDLSLKLATDVIGQAAFGVDFGLSKPQSSASVKSPTSSHNDKEVEDFIKQHMYSTCTLKMDLSGVNEIRELLLSSKK